VVAPAKSDALSPERHASTSRLAGAAGLGYVAAVSIENMEILEAPTLDSSVGEITPSSAPRPWGS
jgi:hypothetical protein